ncbi:hypothetical protein COT75_04695 [Candidatus Beckwithbacteria bacterium CG10_big_fil_rev_8_21_14_0_10_34_10]|uniref:Twin-arginine translocation signal domain-containing protein n=1 Tax=Candidatus Beckwithbacteria bacterium CG10_big_fil_rev_8_21_14_0_10_34_10 TaxID=1974495 RepID=A0A2H0W7W4_9BACT|nr:MAG: hypothetical protein COT75_04695 [Candidatus Beckwithbacteria bacterium CG10_big_fil_rev_8_21_14_0_10_34_10]
MNEKLPIELSRRDFLKLTATDASALLLSRCSSQEASELISIPGHPETWKTITNDDSPKFSLDYNLTRIEIYYKGIERKNIEKGIEENMVKLNYKFIDIKNPDECPIIVSHLVGSNEEIRLYVKDRWDNPSVYCFGQIINIDEGWQAMDSSHRNPSTQVFVFDVPIFISSPGESA